MVGGRKWIYAGDVALHTRFLLSNQKHLYEKWNSSGNKFLTNLDFAEKIASILGKKLKYKFIPVQRKGHNTYFSMSSDKFYNLGWKEDISIYDRLADTVNWYKENTKWLDFFKGHPKKDDLADSLLMTLHYFEKPNLMKVKKEEDKVKKEEDKEKSKKDKCKSKENS